MTAIITAPGLYADLDENDYHADKHLAPELGRSLSSSGAKTLLKSPAKFAYERENPRPSTQAMDVGSVAHHLILHRGGRLLIVDAYDWKLKANQQRRDAERAKGTVVVHRGELLPASRMARAVRNNAKAAQLLEKGEPEKSLYWIDPETGVTCRGRIDWLRDDCIVDVKTAQTAAPAGFAKAAADYGYRESLAFYRRGVHALTGRLLPVVLIVVEKEAPYLVATYTLDDDDLAWGDARMDEALRLYAECESTGEWPGYSPDIEFLNFPRWAY